MRIAAVLLLAACSGTPQGEVGTTASVEAAGPDEAPLLKAGPPPIGPSGRALSKLADALGLGLARCPVDGMGRVGQIFGTPRDHLRTVGPTWTLEVRPEDTKPWNPTYDTVPVEDRWVTLLAEPGSKGSYLRVGDRILALTWPAAAKGQAVSCTAVEEVEPRVVAGKVEPRPDATMWTVGCTEDPQAVASDGSYVIDAVVPCTLWLESSDAHRTQKVAIEGGAGKKQINEFTWSADDIQTGDRLWTDAGKARLKEIALQLADEITYQLETLERIEGELSGDDPAQKVVQRWRNEMVNWQRMTQRVHAGIEGKVPL